MNSEEQTKIINFALGDIIATPHLERAGDGSRRILRYNYADYDNKGDNYNHIIDKVYVGNILSFDDDNFITGLDQIISLVKPPATLNHLHSTQILFDDMDYVDILPYAERVYTLLDTDRKTLVHCAAGRSRSCAVVLYYIMKKHNKTYQEAYDILKVKRIDMCINEGFIRALKKYEEGVNVYRTVS